MTPEYPPLQPLPTVPVFERSPETVAFCKAWPDAQKAMGAVLRDKTNPAFKSDYADLAAVTAAVLPALNDNGFGLMQFVSYDPAEKVVLCRTEISHESGEWKAALTAVPVTKIDAQGIGSAQTYGRRYSLMAITGVAPEDDDGNSAVGQSKAPANGRISSAQAKKDGVWDRMTAEIAACRDPDTLIKWGRDNAAAIQELPTKWQSEVRDEFGAKLQALRDEQRREQDVAEGYGDGA